jgi:hypothetical protein
LTHAVCLIPTTRPDNIDRATESALKFGWDPVVLVDVHREDV